MVWVHSEPQSVGGQQYVYKEERKASNLLLRALCVPSVAKKYYSALTVLIAESAQPLQQFGHV